VRKHRFRISPSRRGRLDGARRANIFEVFGRGGGGGPFFKRVSPAGIFHANSEYIGGSCRSPLGGCHPMRECKRSILTLRCAQELA